MPDTAYGSRAIIEAIEESAWGTTPGSPDADYLEFQSEGLGAPADPHPSANIPRNRMVTHARRGRMKPGGNIESVFGLKGFGTTLKHALGANNTTGAGPYTHTITPAATLPPGRTIHKYFEDIGKGLQFKGCRINRLAMSFPNEGDVTITQDLLAREMVETSALLDSAPTDLSDLAIKEWDAILKIDDTQFACLESLDYELLNNAKMLYGLGLEAAALTGAGLRLVTGNMNIFVTDLVEFAKFVAGTAVKLEVVITQGANSCTITLAECIYTGDPVPKIDNPDERVAQMPFHAKGLSADDIKIVLVNDVATI